MTVAKAKGKVLMSVVKKIIVQGSLTIITCNRHNNLIVQATGVGNE